MDAYDLFKKLGTGAKFDFKRFRGDAERLQLVRPKHSVHVKNKDVGEKSNENLNHKEEAPDVSDGSEDDSGSEVESSDSDSSELEQSDSELVSQEDSETELQILGNLRSKGDNSLDPKLDRKMKKKLRKVKSEEKLAALKQEEINHTRNKNRMHVYGTDIPEPVETFDALTATYKLHPRLMQNIESIGYKTPTPIQKQAIPAMLDRREVMACAPTGSGKTAAFIIPMLYHLKEPRNEGIRGLVLAPTRELAKQTYREFQRLSEGIGFRVIYIDKIPKDIDKFKKGLTKKDILVSTPNRLVYMVKESPALVSLSSVQWLVVDESDKLFEEGKTGFREQLATIYKACDGPSVRRAMFSATFAFDVEEWCKLNLDNVIQVYIGARNSATRSIKQSLLFVGAESGKLLAMRDLIRKGVSPPVLVFVQSKERAKDLFHELIYDGMNVDVIHADRTQLQRDNVVRSFREGKIWFLICTELMGRGIDFKGVNLVINYDFPNSAISYIHRIGRTGRAGHRGRAITFFTEDDAVNLRSIANVMKASGCKVPDYMLQINKPSKKDRRLLAKRVPARDRISTQPFSEVQSEEKRKQLMKRRMRREKEAKRKRLKAQAVQSNDSFKKEKRKSTDHSNGPLKKKKPD